MLESCCPDDEKFIVCSLEILCILFYRGRDLTKEQFRLQPEFLCIIVFKLM